MLAGGGRANIGLHPQGGCPVGELSCNVVGCRVSSRVSLVSLESFLRQAQVMAAGRCLLLHRQGNTPELTSWGSWRPGRGPQAKLPFLPPLTALAWTRGFSLGARPNAASFDDFDFFSVRFFLQPPARGDTTKGTARSPAVCPTRHQDWTDLSSFLSLVHTLFSF